MILYNPTVSGSLVVTGSLTTTGTITSQTLVVQTITSSIEFNTGSTRNGTLSTNTHEFTGSVLMSGSLTVGGATTLGGNTLLSYSSNTTTANAFPRLGVSNTNATQQDYNVSELYVSAGNGAVNGSLLASYSSTFPSSTPSITLRNTGNSPLYFSTNGTIRQTISGDGKVGIGLTDPRSILEVQKTSGNTSLGVASGFNLLLSQGGAINEYSQIGLGYANATTPAVIAFLTTNAAAYTSGDLIFALRNVTTDTVPTERMRLTSGGNLLVGQTADNPIVSHTAGARIAAESIFSNSSSECMSIQRMNSTGVMAVFYYWSGVGGYVNVGNISTNGSTITFSGTALSDDRYKENIAPITNALESINQVDWVEFKFKENQKNSAGVTAQQLQTIDGLSKFVIDGSDEESYKAVDYNAIIGYLGKAIQELSAKNTALEEILQRNNIQ
jgi:hypothetical protein